MATLNERHQAEVKALRGLEATVRDALQRLDAARQDEPVVLTTNPDTILRDADTVFVAAATGGEYIDTPSLLVRELHAFRAWLDRQPGPPSETLALLREPGTVGRFLADRALVANVERS